VFCNAKLYFTAYYIRRNVLDCGTSFPQFNVNKLLRTTLTRMNVTSELCRC
jgi:hypothetical protein